MKYLSFTLLLVLIGILSSHPQNSATAGNPSEIMALPQSFPAGSYTPFGYIDNPYHSMVLHRSGVIRSVPPLGFGYWKRSFWGSYAEGPRGHVNYLSFLQMSVKMDGVSLVEPEDFKANKVDLRSAYHTKNVMSYDWNFHGVNFSFKYFLPRENTLTCLVEMENTGGQEKQIILNATNIYGLWEIEWWGSDGLSSVYVSQENASVQKIWAYGDVFVLGSDWPSFSHKSTENREQWVKWARETDSISHTMLFGKDAGPVYAMQSYQIDLPPHSEKSGMVYLSRGKNQDWTLTEYHVARAEASNKLKIQLQEDERFWSQCPQLDGDWPESWKHGWVYDWETLRMNIRRPVGIFKHPWDAMQVHSPRAVLGETALDMFTYSFADPALAKEVIYGTFADALAPNMPCAREDGSVNMIGADGSECGTAPMWGFPFHLIRSIYNTNGDRQWIRDLYPHLKAYIEWWLENRTDEEGWFHCNNSWESGQDGSRRFLVKGEGDPATFVRTVDVEASVAEAMRILAEFAPLAGHGEDQQLWQDLAARRVENTRSMFVQGWFRDVDGRNGKPIIFNDYHDAMMLVPLTCGIATPEQIEVIRPKLGDFVSHERWLQWPPAVMAYTEAAWNAGEQLHAAEAIKNIADRVYARTDSRSPLFVNKEEPFAYRIPGVANEFWPAERRPAGGENYGWGATLPGHIIRDIVGFRETEDLDGNSFYLAPAIPKGFWETGKTLGLSHLHFQGAMFDLEYHISGENQIQAVLDLKSGNAQKVKITDSAGKEIPNTPTDAENSFLLKNGEKYIVQLN